MRFEAGGSALPKQLPRRLNPRQPIRLRLPIRIVLIVGMVVVIICLMAVTTLIDIQRQRSTEEKDLQDRGYLLANSLNAVLVSPLRSSDFDRVAEVSTAMWAQTDVSFVKIFDQDGNLLFGPAKDQSQIGAGIRDESVLRQVANLHTTQVWRSDGLEIITPVSSGARLIGAVQFGLSSARIDDEIRSLTLNRLWQTGFLILAGIAISILIASYLTRPITQLLRATNKVAGGDLQARVQDLPGQEMGQLGSSFNSMAEELEEMVRALRESRTRIVTAQETVRRDLAVHLHGPVQGRLLALKAQLENLVEEENLGPEVSTGLRVIINDMDQVIREEISTLSRQLYPAIVRRGLVPAIQSLRDQYESSLDIHLNLDQELAARERLDSRVIPEQTRLAAYRIVEEALNNVVKHSGADRADIAVTLDGEGLVLRVSDNGTGFDPGGTHSGLGLRVMLDYAEASNGRCEVESAYAEGTTVVAVLPANEQ